MRYDTIVGSNTIRRHGLDFCDGHLASFFFGGGKIIPSLAMFLDKD